MFRYITLFLILFVSNIYADIENYYVGLRAFDDKFYDVAADSLKKFVDEDNSSRESNFAKYLLYKIHMNTHEYKTAKFYLDIIKNINDERFDSKTILFDDIFLTALEDCEKAYKIIDSHKDVNLTKALLGTKCFLDNNTDIIDLPSMSDRMKFYYIMQIENREKIKETFELIDKKKLSNMELKALSIKLYKLELMKEFWDVYERYRDKDTINLAIERVWKTGKYEDVLKGYKYNSKLQLLPETYCMVLDANFKLNRTFDCSIVDKCFSEKNENYAKAMFQCLVNNADNKKLKQFVDSLSDNYTSFFCETGEYLISNKMLGKSRYGLLKKCGNLYDISENLLKNRFFDELILLHRDIKDDRSHFYLSYSYGIKNNKKELKKYYSMIGDLNLKDRLKKRFGKILR